MMNSLLRAGKEICARHKRLFAHTVVYGVAALQFGCAAIHNKNVEMLQQSNDPAVVQQAVMGELEDIKGKTPSSFIEPQVYHDIILNYRKAVEDLRKEDGRSFDERKSFVLKMNNDFRQSLIIGSIDVFSDAALRSNFEKAVSALSWDEICKIVDDYDGYGTQSALPLGGTKSPFILVVMQNPDKLFSPGESEEKFLDYATGMFGLRKFVGPEFSQAMRLYILCHELTHAGDKQYLQMTDRDAPGLTDVEWAKGEAKADIEALMLYYNLTGDVEFLKTIMNYRALVTVISGDEIHPTQFELAKLIKKIDPSVAVPEYMPIEDVVGTIKGLVQKSKIAECADAPLKDMSKGPALFSGPDQIACMDDNRKKLDILLANETDNKAIMVLKFALDGQKYFDSILKGETKIRANLLQRIRLLASPAAAGPR